MPASSGPSEMMVDFSACDVRVVDLANLLASVATPGPGCRFGLVECICVLPAVVTRLVPKVIELKGEL